MNLIEENFIASFLLSNFKDLKEIIVGGYHR